MWRLLLIPLPGESIQPAIAPWRWVVEMGWWQEGHGDLDVEKAQDVGVWSGGWHLLSHANAIEHLCAVVTCIPLFCLNLCG